MAQLCPLTAAEQDLHHEELQELNDEPPLKRIKVESSEDVPDDQEILINSYLQVMVTNCEIFTTKCDMY